MNNDTQIRRAINEIAGKSKDLLASIEEIKNKSYITVKDLKAIKNQEIEIRDSIDSIIEKSE